MALCFSVLPALLPLRRIATLLFIIIVVTGCDLRGGMLKMASALSPNADTWVRQCTNSKVTENDCFLIYTFSFVGNYGKFDAASLSFSSNIFRVTGNIDPGAHSVIRFGAGEPYYFDKDSSYESDVLTLTDEMRQEISQTDVAFLRIYPWPSGIQEVKIPLGGLIPYISKKPK